MCSGVQSIKEDALPFKVKEIKSFGAFMDVLPGLRPEEPVVVVNQTHNDYEGFRTGVAGAEAAILDFDGTVHAHNQWMKMRAIMRADLAEEDAEDARVAYFENPNRTQEETAQFLLRSVSRLVRSGVTRVQMHEEMRGLVPRRGTVELMRSFEHVCFVSFGLRPNIASWLEHYMGMTVHVEALDLVFDTEAPFSLRGFIHNTIVVDHNKGDCSRSFQTTRGLDPSRVIVIGDAPTDLHMLESRNIGILVVPHVDAQEDRRRDRMSRLEDLWPNVSAVIVSDCLTPLADMRASSKSF